MQGERKDNNPAEKAMNKDMFGVDSIANIFEG